MGLKERYLELKVDGAKKGDEEEENEMERFWVIDIFGFGNGKRV